MKSYLAPISAFILFAILAVPAAFSAPPQEPLTVTVQGDGTVTSDPAGIICPADCTENYEKASRVTLTATADPNGSFLGWEGDCFGTQPTCELKMKAPTNVTAVFDTVTVAYPAPVPQTGQTRCWDDQPAVPHRAYDSHIDCTNTLQDGDLQKGLPSPVPRFMDNADGSVTDNLTGLVWLKNVVCLGRQTWFSALVSASNLAAGMCGLTDGSTQGEWRVPNIKEFLSILSYQVPDPNLAAVDIYALPENYPFTGLGFNVSDFWTSTTVARDGRTSNAFVVRLNGGTITSWYKGEHPLPPYVWPVRDSQ